MTTMGKSSTERGSNPTAAGSVATGTSETPPAGAGNPSDLVDELVQARREGRSIQSLAATAKRRLGRSVSREEVRDLLAMRGER